MTWIPIRENTAAISNEKYLIDSSTAEFSVILPRFPTIGSYVVLADSIDVSINPVSVLAQEEFPFRGGSIFFIMDDARSQYEFIFDGFNWLAYNVSREGTKISEFPQQPISQISNDDLIPYVNKVGEFYQSTSIPFINLKQKITEDSFTSIGEIINAINTSEASGTLNIKTFDGQPSSYYLNYTNLTNKPPIPTRVGQLDNDIGLLQNLSTLTTDALAEGQINKYLSETTFRALFNPAFAESYRIFSGDFPEQTVLDSLYDIPASPVTALNATEFVNITRAENMRVFFPTKRIRIYGAGLSPVANVPTPAIGSAAKRGFVGLTAGAVIRYKVIQFNFLNGEFSATSNESNPISNIDLDGFNDINNISLIFSRTSTEYGALIYRSVGSAAFVLIDVLGPRQLGITTQNIEYVDYGKFNFVPWSRKNLAANNIYDNTTGLVHFPFFVNSINTASRGWLDAIVIEVDVLAGRIILDSAIYMNQNIIISEDDTDQVQNAINIRRNLGVNSLTLNDRRYIISKLELPSNFSLFGRGQATTLRKIAWDFSPNNKIIYSISPTSENTFISNFSIDGNMQNQWLKTETGDPYSNYTIDLKEQGVGNTIERLRISNVIGGGIASSRPNKLLIDKNRIENSGMGDNYEYSPLVADDGDEVVITNNIFKNFTSSIDISLSDNGVFTSNIVQNVGTGIIIYGSKFLISAPNLIRGPAGEFIPGPDVVNSTFDSVNIKLNPDNTFVSDVYVYQETGKIFSISANRAELNFRMDKLRLVANAEELYGEVLIPDGLLTRKPIQREFAVGLDPAFGQFKFGISTADVNTILTNFSVTTLRLTEPNHIGLVYSAELTEYVPSGNIIGTPTIVANNPLQYVVTLRNFKNMRVGRRVRMLGHLSTPNLNEIIGVVTAINTFNANPNGIAPQELEVTITYNQPILVAGTVLPDGTSGQITAENTFTLAKGRVL